MGSIGTQELIIILVIVLLLFGAKRIPEIARSMGHGIREFKKATKEITSEVNSSIDAKSEDQARGSRPSPEERDRRS
jgi:sec-independent protein translocase protein TatA